MILNAGRVATLASIGREEMALTFCIHGVVRRSKIIPTPAVSCLRVVLDPFLPFPFPLAMYGMVVCSFSLDEKYVVYPCPSRSVLVLPCFVSCRMRMFVLVRCIQSLSSWRLLIALMPLQLRVAILNLVW